jgi:hypothetical protein
VVNLQRVLAHDNALDEQLQHRLALLEGDARQPRSDALAERSQAAEHVVGTDLLLAQELLLPMLLGEHVAPLVQQMAALGQLLEGDHAGLVGIQQAPVLPPKPF